MVWKTYTLIEFSESSFRHGRIIAPVDLGNVISFHAGYLVHGKIPGKWHLYHLLKRMSLFVQYVKEKLLQMITLKKFFSSLSSSKC